MNGRNRSVMSSLTRRRCWIRSMSTIQSSNIFSNSSDSVPISEGLTSFDPSHNLQEQKLD